NAYAVLDQLNTRWFEIWGQEYFSCNYGNMHRRLAVYFATLVATSFATFKSPQYADRIFLLMRSLFPPALAYTVESDVISLKTPDSKFPKQQEELLNSVNDSGFRCSTPQPPWAIVDSN